MYYLYKQKLISQGFPLLISLFMIFPGDLQSTQNQQLLTENTLSIF